jgi:shikimate dehydrogenase
MTGIQEFRVPLDALSPGAICCDLVYTPLKTKFLTAAEEAGCTIVDGLGMLLHQAVPGFERWFGHRPEVTDGLREAVLNA